jgi:hypothetical protein
MTTGQPQRVPSDKDKFNNEFLENLKLQIKLNDQNLQANRLYQTTGQMPASTQMADTRSTAEKLADIEGLKSSIVADLKPIAEPAFAFSIINGVINSPLNIENSLFRFLAQNATQLSQQLQKKYKFGIAGDANDVEIIVQFIEDLYNKTQNTFQSVKGYMNSNTNQGMNSKGNVLSANNTDNVILEMRDIEKRLDYFIKRSDDNNLGFRQFLQPLFTTVRQVLFFLPTSDQLQRIINNIENQGAGNSVNIFYRTLDLLKDLPRPASLQTLIDKIEKGFKRNDGRLIQASCNSFINLFAEILSPPNQATLNNFRRTFIQQAQNEARDEAYINRVNTIQTINAERLNRDQAIKAQRVYVINPANDPVNIQDALAAGAVPPVGGPQAGVLIPPAVPGGQVPAPRFNDVGLGNNILQGALAGAQGGLMGAANGAINGAMQGLLNPQNVGSAGNIPGNVGRQLPPQFTDLNAIPDDIRQILFNIRNTQYDDARLNAMFDNLASNIPQVFSSPNIPANFLDVRNGGNTEDKKNMIADILFAEVHDPNVQNYIRDNLGYKQPPLQGAVPIQLRGEEPDEADIQGFLNRLNRNQGGRDINDLFNEFYPASNQPQQRQQAPPSGFSNVQPSNDTQQDIARDAYKLRQALHNGQITQDQFDYYTEGIDDRYENLQKTVKQNQPSVRVNPVTSTPIVSKPPTFEDIASGNFQPNLVPAMSASSSGPVFIDQSSGEIIHPSSSVSFGPESEEGKYELSEAEKKTKYMNERKQIADLFGTNSDLSLDQRDELFMQYYNEVAEYTHSPQFRYISNIVDSVPKNKRQNQSSEFKELARFVTNIERLVDDTEHWISTGDIKSISNNSNADVLLPQILGDPNFVKVRGKPVVKKGTGLRKKKGRGLVADYRDFGINKINHKKLNDGILTIRRKSNINIPDMPSKRISRKLQKIITHISGGGVPDFNEINNLDDNEKDYLHKLISKSNLNERLSVPAPSKDQEEKDFHQFEVMKGEIMSGNDSKELVKKFKVLILKLSKQNVLPKNEVNELLQDLLSLGY